MNSKTDRLIRTIQRNENLNRANRVTRLTLALKAHGAKLLDHELTNLENALQPAVGRIVMDRPR
jgi:hypothetical protein